MWILSKKNHKKTINLIPQDEFESSTFGRILKWALSSFRVMVIATEVIVMAAFLSRFWLDARNSDLNEEINIAKSQIIAYSDVERDFRSIQNRISIVKKYYSEDKLSKFIEDVSMSIPNDVILESLAIDNKEVTIKAMGLNELSIIKFILNLEKIDNVAEVSLNQVSSDTDTGGISIFTIRLNLK